MRRILSCFLLAFFLASSGWLSIPASAQQTQPSGDPKAAEFSDLFERWQKSQDPEQKITLGEQLLALEPALGSWPLEAARERALADIRFELGSGYLARAHGDRADNLERAIAHLEAALTAWTRESAPQDWARAHNNLAIAYINRIRGEVSDNQELAIAHLEAPLTVFTPEAAPQEWGQLQNNLAVVYMGRARGDHEANLESAIRHFEAALSVFKQETDPYRWAMAQHNLAAVYGARKRGNRQEDREKQIAHVEAALTVFRRETFPQEWAQSQHNLAIAFVDRIRGERADNLDQAIAHFEGALTVITRDALPDQWAQAQHNMGIAYSNRDHGDRSANKRKAIAAFESALTIFTREGYPHDHLRTSRVLGRAFLDAGDLGKAGQAYASARDAFLVLLGQGIEEAEAKALLADAGPLFADAAFAAAQRGEAEAALQLANEGRARLLTVAMKLQTLELPPEERRRLDELRNAIRAERQAIDATQGTDRADALKKLIALRGEMLTLIKGGSRDGAGAALAEARATAAQGGAVVVPIVTGMGGKIIVMTGTSDLTTIDLPELNIDRLSLLLIGPSDGPPAGWLGAYFVHYLDPAEHDRRWPEWLAAIDALGPDLWRLFGARLDAVLKERGLKPGARLVWLPTGWLGTLPLGLAQDPDSKRRLGDDYEIVYAPSLEVLAAARALIAKPAPATLTAVINPTGDLPGTEKEGAIVASHFAGDARTLLEQAAATPDAVLSALKGRTHWHFASHGTFAWADARQSALVMYGGARLSVGRLLDTVGLGRPRLVVLSACETGLSEITSNPDEFIGLPGTFTALGAAGVLGTLWPVSDDATALLIAKFYELHIDEQLSPPTALHRAQAWMRNATNDELDSYARTAAAQGRLQNRHLTEIEQALSKDGLARSRNSAIVQWIEPESGAAPATTGAVATAVARPYAHPYFWAGFIHTGL